MNKRGQKTRNHIKACAGSLFAEKGFKQVTMKDICEAAHISRGGLYCHYESTRQIFQELLYDMTGRQDDDIDRQISQNQPAAAILDHILEIYRREMPDSRSSLSMAIYEYFSLPDIADQPNALYQQYLFWYFSPYIPHVFPHYLPSAGNFPFGKRCVWYCGKQRLHMLRLLLFTKWGCC